MSRVPRRANPGKFAVICWHTDGSEEREFFTFNTDTREDALGLRDKYERDSREHGDQSGFGVYDEHGIRLDVAPLEGVCHFHSETGTEGGDWAFQDGRFITKNTTRFSCKKCGLCWDKAEQPAGPVNDGLLEGQKSLFGKTYCAPGTHDFDLIYPESWSYEGLHVLCDGDRLTILSPDNPQQVVWSGTISLRQHPLFTEVASGFWIHADQDGVARDTWAEYFFKNYPAKLVPAPEPKK